MLFWAQGAISPLGLYILSSNFSSKPFVFLSRFLFSSLFILTSLCFRPTTCLEQELLLGDNGTSGSCCLQKLSPENLLFCNFHALLDPFLQFAPNICQNLAFSSFSFSRIVFQFAAAPLPPMEREANFNRLKDDPLDLPRWRCGFQGRRFSSSTLWKKRLPWNPALSLLLAKFFALFAIFLCQLLFPNKQHLHRF